MKDRFTEASLDLPGRNPFIYANSMATYGHQVIEHSRVKHEPDLCDTRSAECILNCDPMPFGD